ncbi:MAG: hypothetical protein QGI86_18280 [Candidatus Poribacteria bacterium]|jgi:hypothetical protein|nr:hypothetical protein [Candidatus Poribacteria bacterium]MDP6751729.1 hypothetical protein [Candidatus Poribacteria bacterium]MDP7000073.1 hypothetical protein [Candidatus Poribacteria bacterium]|tara:strand:- start:38 stop:211 length:174 start_codon:yes stop_codon:yes gene_type:complete
MKRVPGRNEQYDPAPSEVEASSYSNEVTDQQWQRIQLYLSTDIMPGAHLVALDLGPL